MGEEEGGGDEGDIEDQEEGRGREVGRKELRRDEKGWDFILRAKRIEVRRVDELGDGEGQGGERG